MPAAPMVPLTIKVEATFPNPVELLVFMSLKKEASFAPIFFQVQHNGNLTNKIQSFPVAHLVGNIARIELTRLKCK